jgi:hypothetical protein
MRGCNKQMIGKAKIEVEASQHQEFLNTNNSN